VRQQKNGCCKANRLPTNGVQISNNRAVYGGRTTSNKNDAPDKIAQKRGKSRPRRTEKRALVEGPQRPGTIKFIAGKHLNVRTWRKSRSPFRRAGGERDLRGEGEGKKVTEKSKNLKSAVRPRRQRKKKIRETKPEEDKNLASMAKKGNGHQSKGTWVLGPKKIQRTNQTTERMLKSRSRD